MYLIVCPFLNKLTGKKETMGIIETIKQITFVEGFEKG